MLTLERVSYQPREVAMVAHASCRFEAGKLTAIIGPNGAGKTTLLKLAAGLLPASSGAISAEAMRFSDQQARARHIAYLPQFQSIAWPLMCRDVVALGLLPYGARDEARVMHALEICGVAQFSDRTIDTLSGGEQARVHVARLLVGDAQCLLFDEPVQSLDAAGALAVMGVLRRAADDGLAVALVLHDLHLAAQFCDHVLVMDKAVIAAQGAPDEVLSAACLSPIFGVEFVAVDAAGHNLLVAQAIKD